MDGKSDSSDGDIHMSKKKGFGANVIYSDSDSDKVAKKKKKRRLRIKQLGSDDEDEAVVSSSSSEEEIDYTSSARKKKQILSEKMEELKKSRRKKNEHVKQEIVENELDENDGEIGNQENQSQPGPSGTREKQYFPIFNRKSKHSNSLSSDDEDITPKKKSKKHKIVDDDDGEDEDATCNNQSKQAKPEPDGSSSDSSSESLNSYVSDEDAVHRDVDVLEVPQHFLLVLESLLAEACNPGSLVNNIEESQDVKRAFIKLEGDLHVRENRMNSQAWRKDFRLCSQLFPEHESTGGFRLHRISCEACHFKRNRPSSEIRHFMGTRYDRKTLQEVLTEDESDSDDSDSSRDSRDLDVKEKPDIKELRKSVFHIGSHCSSRNSIYHDIYHFNYNLLQDCQKMVLKIETRDPQLDMTEIIGQALQNEGWVQLQYKNLLSLYRTADNFDLEGERMGNLLA